MWGFIHLKDVLDVVMIPITVAVIAPWITKQWQDRQRGGQIKTELVAEISGLVMTTVMSVLVSNKRDGQQTMANDDQEHELDRVYKNWRVNTCVIGSKLHAYFPNREKGDEQIHKKWDKFSEKLTMYYEESRKNICKNSLDKLNEGKEVLFEEKAKIIEEILTSQITGFKKCQH